MIKKPIELTEFTCINESTEPKIVKTVKITKQAKEKIYTQLYYLVKNDGIPPSEQDRFLTVEKFKVPTAQKIDAVMDALNPENMLGKILYTESPDDSFDQSKKRLMSIVALLEDVVDEVTDLADAEKLYDKLQTIKGFNFNEIIRKIKQKIVTILTELVEISEISLLEKITLCCDAINPEGTIGKVLFHQRGSTAPCLSAKSLKSAMDLMEYKVIPKIASSDDKAQLYNVLYNKLAEIRKMQEINSDDKDILYYLLFDIDQLKKNHLINIQPVEQKVISYAELIQNYSSLRNENIIFDAQLLKTELLDKETSTSNKIKTACQSVSLVCNAKKLSDVIGVFSIIKVTLIPQLNNCKDVKELFSSLMRVSDSLQDKDRAQYKSQFDDPLNQLRTRYKLLSPLTNKNDPHNDAAVDSIRAAWQGIRIAWNHYFESLNEKFSSFQGETHNQVTRMQSIKDLFDKLNDVINSPVPIDPTENQAALFYGNISKAGLLISEELKKSANDSDIPFISKDTKEMKVIHDLSYETTSIFEIRDLLYKSVAGIEIPKAQLSKNIIMRNS